LLPNLSVSGCSPLSKDFGWSRTQSPRRAGCILSLCFLQTKLYAAHPVQPVAAVRLSRLALTVLLLDRVIAYEPVVKIHYPIALFSVLLGVRYLDNGCAFAIQAPERFHDLFPPPRMQVAGRFIGQKQSWSADNAEAIEDNVAEFTAAEWSEPNCGAIL
jgi:hypothetical protein